MSDKKKPLTVQQLDAIKRNLARCIAACGISDAVIIFDRQEVHGVVRATNAEHGHECAVVDYIYKNIYDIFREHGMPFDPISEN